MLTDPLDTMTPVYVDPVVFDDVYGYQFPDYYTGRKIYSPCLRMSQFALRDNGSLITRETFSMDQIALVMTALVPHLLEAGMKPLALGITFIQDQYDLVVLSVLSSVKTKMIDLHEAGEIQITW